MLACHLAPVYSYTDLQFPLCPACLVTTPRPRIPAFWNPLWLLPSLFPARSVLKGKQIPVSFPSWPLSCLPLQITHPGPGLRAQTYWNRIPKFGTCGRSPGICTSTAIPGNYEARGLGSAAVWQGQSSCTPVSLTVRRGWCPDKTLLPWNLKVLGKYFFPFSWLMRGPHKENCYQR